MTLDQFKTLISTYGASEAHWPTELVAGAQHLLAMNEEARKMMTEEAELDDALDRYKVATDTDALSLRIMAALPNKNFVDRFLDWLIPESPAHGVADWIGRPALASALPLVIGLAVGSLTNFGEENVSTDSWEEEIYLLALTEDVTFLADTVLESRP